MVRPHNFNKLPLWVQKRIHKLEYEIRERDATILTLESMACFIHGREWHSINASCDGTCRLPKGQDSWNLYVMTQNSPVCICSLYAGDLLFVGRMRDRTQKPETVLPGA